MNLIQLKALSLLVLYPYLIPHVATCSPSLGMHIPTEKKTHKEILFCISSEASSLSPSGEPSPPAVHGQRGMGKAYRLGLVKQDDGGMPIVEYIVKYKTVSNHIVKNFLKG